MICIYRCFDDNDRLLYIGVTKSFESRMQTHRRYTSWFSSVHRIEKVDLDESINRLQAHRIETQKIKEEQPFFNVCGKVIPLEKKVPYAQTRRKWAARREAILRDVKKFGPRSHGTVARKHGVTRQRIWKIIQTERNKIERTAA